MAGGIIFARGGSNQSQAYQPQIRPPPVLNQAVAPLFGVRTPVTTLQATDTTNRILDASTATLPSGWSETRSTTATYYNSSGVVSTAVANALRTDYTSAGVLRGYEIEPAATNIGLQSQNQSLAPAVGPWQPDSGITVTAPSVADPAGGTSGCTITYGGTGGAIFLANTAVLANTTYTFSAWVKQSAISPSSFIRLTSNNTAAWNTGVSQKFSLTTSWVRISVTGNISTTTVCNIGFDNRDSAGTLDSSVSGKVDVFGSQLELGSSATSYIPTTTATVTRAADAASFTLGAAATDLELTFDDGSVQIYTGVPSGGTFNVPTSGSNRLLYIDDNTIAAGSVGSAAGTGAATAVGESTANGVGASLGSSTVTAVGASTAASAGSSAGSGAATAVGKSTAASAGSAAGSGAATAVGASTARSVGAPSGSGTATAVGASIAASAGASSGSGAATAVGASTAASVGSSTGAGAATAKSISSAVGSAAGAGSATAVAVSTALGVGSAAGTETVTAVGAATDASVGSAAGSSTASAAGASTAAAVGASAGSGVATAIGAATAAGVGSSAGHGTAAAFTGIVAQAAGSGAASGIGSSIAAAVGASAGLATVAATSSSASAGSAVGTAVVSGIGQAASNAVGSSAGSGTASGVGTTVAGTTVSAVGSAAGSGVAAAFIQSVDFGSDFGSDFASQPASLPQESTDFGGDFSDDFAVFRAVQIVSGTGLSAGGGIVSGVGSTDVETPPVYPVPTPVPLVWHPANEYRRVQAPRANRVHRHGTELRKTNLQTMNRTHRPGAEVQRSGPLITQRDFGNDFNNDFTVEVIVETSNTGLSRRPGTEMRRSNPRSMKRRYG